MLFEHFAFQKFLKNINMKIAAIFRTLVTVIIIIKIHKPKVTYFR